MTTISASGPRNDSGSSPEKNTHIAPFGHSSRRRDDTQRGRGSRPFDVAIFLASYILSTSARIFLAVSDTVLAAAAEHERHMIGEPRSNASAPPPRASSVGRISSLTGRSYRFVRAVSSLSPPLPFPSRTPRHSISPRGCARRETAACLRGPRRRITLFSLDRRRAARHWRPVGDGRQSPHKPPEKETAGASQCGASSYAVRSPALAPNIPPVADPGEGSALRYCLGLTRSPFQEARPS